MKILGLLGGVASGKSTVAEMFRQLGAQILDADRAGPRSPPHPRRPRGDRRPLG